MTFPPRFLLVFLLALAGGGATAARAAEVAAKPRETLVFKDGDRLQGRLLRREGKVLVFQSDRFGEIRVAEDGAVIIPAEKSEATVAPAANGAGKPAVTREEKLAKVAEKKEEHAEAEQVRLWEYFSPAVLTADLRKFFGPWHGKLAFASEMVSNSADQTIVSLEGSLDRKWATNEVQLKGRYDYSQTNNVPTTDLLKAEGSIRHDFASGKFLLYHPTVEWNRASFTNSVPSDYLVLQQEFGAGVSLWSTPARKVRVGLSENWFNTWSVAPSDPRSSRLVQSAFVETEWKMPWRLLLTERAVYYYSFTSERTGWENHLELTKKFSETLSTAIRHEVREGSPDGTAQDYRRLKLLIGVDF